MPRFWKNSDALAATLCLCFVLVQLKAVGYGTWINDLPHIAHTPVDFSSAVERLHNNTVVNPTNELTDDQNTWLVRYKLYAITADEMVNLMALSRISPTHLAFDPHFYVYGGAYLYPLGAWYGIGYLLGFFPLPTVQTLLDNPDVVDALYIWGRVFVLLVFTISAWVLYKTFRRLYRSPTSLALLILYLAAPGSLIFSLVMKPHWYGLVWAALVLYTMVSVFSAHKADWRRIFFLGLVTGLAVASSTAYAPFFIIVFGALVVAWKKSYLTLRQLVNVPLVALLVFIVTNPYIILNYSAYKADSAALLGWYTTWSSVTAIGLFIKNSLVAGFGVAGLLALGAAVGDIVHPRSLLRTGMALALVGPVVVFGVITSTVSYWNDAYRLIPFFLPLALLYIGRVYLFKYLAIAALLTVCLSIPLLLAYRDEGNPRYSTRMRAVAWIEASLPHGTALCSQMVPYNSVPFDFTHYVVNRDCAYDIEVHHQITTSPVVGQLVAEFKPRLYSFWWPLVYGKANPRVTITKLP